jgi:hypothetical protein
MATYISNATTGDWTSTSTWLTAADGATVPTAPAGFAPQSGARDRFIIRQGHTITYNTSGVFGNGGNGNVPGNTTLVITSASIILSGGRLRASRTQNTALTAVGLIWVGGNDVATSGSFWDWGTLTNPVSAVTASISLSSFTSAGILVRGGTSLTTVAQSACFCGLEKTKNTFLTLSAAANSNTITVDNAFNWKIDDELFIESDTIATSRALSGIRITNVADKTITITPSLNFARLSGTRVGNFTSTVLVETVPSSTVTFGINVQGLPFGIYQFSNITLRDFGQYLRDPANPNTNVLTTSIGAISYDAFFNRVQPIFKGIAYMQVRNPLQVWGPLYVANPGTEESLIEDLAYFGPNNATSTTGLRLGGQSIITVNNYVCYRAYNAIFPSGQFKGTINNSYLNSENATIGNPINPAAAGVTTTFNNCRLRSNTSLSLLDNLVNCEYVNCDISTNPAVGLFAPVPNAFGVSTIRNCTLSAALPNTLAPYSGTTVQRTIRIADVNIYNPNNDNTFRTYNSFHYAEANSSVRKNGIRSLSFTPRIPNERFEKIFTAPAVQGVTQKIKGNLRFDSNYGTATPPTILFSNAVTNTTFTCPAVIDAWHSFEYDLTPNTTGNIEIKITGTSTLSTGFVYVDGLILDPFVKDVRFYGFEVDKNAYRTVDTLTTLTENQVSSVDITNLDRLYDASNYWTINNPLSTSYLDLYTKNGTILDFGDKNIVVDNSSSTNFAYASASKTLTIKTPMLSAGNNFNTLKTTGNVNLTNGDISFIAINGNVIENTPISLSGVNVNGTIIYNTNSPDPTKITYTNCNVLSATNLGTANVVIKKLNSTVTYA